MSDRTALTDKKQQKRTHLTMRFSLSFAPAMFSFLAVIMPASAHAEGGFVSMQAGITDSQDMGKFGTAYKIHFGPNILDNLALEFGLLDMGEASYNDPTPIYDDVSDTNAPRFRNSGHGVVTRTDGNTDEPSKATFTGISSAHPRGFLVAFRYSFDLSDTLRFFVKTGANIWQADLEEIELIANQNKDPVQRRVVSSNKKASAVDQISGGGLLWQPIKNLALRAELETTALDSKDFNRVRFQMITLGAQYEF
jgi:opacity protein-like surface antigen